MPAQTRATAQPEDERGQRVRPISVKKADTEWASKKGDAVHLAKLRNPVKKADTEWARKKDELPKKMDLDKGVDMDQQLNTVQQIQTSRPSNIDGGVAHARLTLAKQKASVENPAKTTWEHAVNTMKADNV